MQGDWFGINSPQVAEIAPAIDGGIAVEQLDKIAGAGDAETITIPGNRRAVHRDDQEFPGIFRKSQPRVNAVG
jgi:hypothetical protein